MKKKLISLTLTLILLVSFAACGTTEADIEGRWKLTAVPDDASGLTGSVDMASLAEYDESIYFVFGSDGTLKLEFDTAALAEDEKAMIDMILAMVTMKYNVTSDTELTLTMSMMGEEDTQTLQYKLDGNTLTIEGAVFERT